MADIRTSSLKSPIDVAEYLFTRLRQLGVRSVHGVPGDFNLAALDYIPQVGLKWVGNCNELNGGQLLPSYTTFRRLRGYSLLSLRIRCGWLCSSQGQVSNCHHIWSWRIVYYQRNRWSVFGTCACRAHRGYALNDISKGQNAATSHPGQWRLQRLCGHE
jgi:hypothetical protein